MFSFRTLSAALATGLLFLSVFPPQAYAKPESPGEEEEAGGLGDHPAERAEWNAMLRRDREGRVLSENRLKALRQACEMPVDPSMANAPAGTFVRSDFGPSVQAAAAFGGVVWQSLGPLPMQSYTGSPHTQYGNVGGRVDAIAIHPTNPSLTLFGSATGGSFSRSSTGC